MNFLKHPAINRAYVASLLYGKNTAITRSKLNQKVRGEIRFTPEELQRLETIRNQIKEAL